MTRLTNDMCGKIANKAIEHKFKPLVGALSNDFVFFACEVYDDTFKSIIKRMKDLPDGWLPTNHNICARFGASLINLNFNGAFASRHNSYAECTLYYLGNTTESYRRFPDKKKGTCCNVYDAEHAFSLRLDDLNNRKSELVQECGAAQKAIAATLDKFNTIEKLLEAWPEIEPFTVGVAPTPPARLPAVPVNHLNTLLDLPVAAE